MSPAVACSHYIYIYIFGRKLGAWHQERQNIPITRSSPPEQQRGPKTVYIPCFHLVESRAISSMIASLILKTQNH